MNRIFSNGCVDSRPRTVPALMAASGIAAAAFAVATFSTTEDALATSVIDPDGIVRDKLIPTDDTGISTRQLEDAVLPLLPQGRTTPAPQER